MSLRHRPFGIKRQSGIGLGRNAAGNDLENLHPEIHQDMIHRVINQRRPRQSRTLPIRDRLVDKVAIFRLRGGRKNQRWIGCRIARLILLHRLKVAGVRHHHCDSFELFKLRG